MSFENVDIYVLDTLPDQNPIEGVMVKVMNETGTAVEGIATTDADGKVSFLLEAPATYHARFFKRGVTIRNPKLLEVLEAPEAPDTNIFDVSGEVFTLPVASHPRLCVVSGYFLRGDGSPAPHVDMHFIAKFKPVLLEDAAVLTERVTTRTDKKGFASLELIRCGQYDVTVEGFEDYQRMISVPDQPDVNLPDLLFPRVLSVSFDPAGPYSLAVGEELTLTPIVTASDKNQLEGSATSDVAWSSSDSNVLAVLVTSDSITLRGVSAGSATISCTRLDSSIIRIPNTDITGQPVSATVT